MNISFYIHQSRLPPDIDLKKLAESLLEGDFKNDKIKRVITNIHAGTSEKALIELIITDSEKMMDELIYLVDFSSLYAAQIAEIKTRFQIKIYIVNAHKSRHPAALVAIADGIKRIKDHHLRCALIDQPKPLFIAANQN